MRSGCSVPDSSVVGIAQIVAHAAGEYILCREGWRRRSSQVTLGRTYYVVLKMFCHLQWRFVQVACWCTVLCVPRVQSGVLLVFAYKVFFTITNAWRQSSQTLWLFNLSKFLSFPPRPFLVFSSLLSLQHSWNSTRGSGDLVAPTDRQHRVTKAAFGVS